LEFYIKTVIFYDTFGVLGIVLIASVVVAIYNGFILYFLVKICTMCMFC